MTLYICTQPSSIEMLDLIRPQPKLDDILFIHDAVAVEYAPFSGVHRAADDLRLRGQVAAGDATTPKEIIELVAQHDRVFIL